MMFNLVPISRSNYILTLLTIFNNYLSAIVPPLLQQLSTSHDATHMRSGGAVAGISLHSND